MKPEALPPVPTVAPFSEPSAGRWRWVVGSLAGLFLGGVFLLAVWGKALDVVLFAETIEAEHLAFELFGISITPALLAWVALGLEAAVGFALVLNLRRWWVLVPTTGLVIFFMFLTGRAYVAYLQGKEPDHGSCGCFGNLFDHTPTEAFWRDFGLMVPPLVLAWLGRPRGPLPWRRLLSVLVLTGGALVFATQAPDLPLDDLATRLKPGVLVKEVCAGRGEDQVCLTGPVVAPWLEEGTWIVVLADLHDETFADAVGERLDEFLAWTGDPDNPGLLVLHSGEKEEETAFKFRSRMPPLDLLPAPKPLLRPLYRTLPRTFVIEDGRVIRTWAGFPPLNEVWTR